MDRSPLHARLRESTARAHEDLEALVGELTSLQAYIRYLRGLHAFRAPIEAALAAADWPPAAADWRPVSIASHLRDDMSDLGISTLPEHPRPHPDTSFSARLGTLYVLEGSSLGARLILRNALALGLDENHGARHLALQANSLANWRAYLQLLEIVRGVDADAMVAAANHAFLAAAQAMTLKR